MSEENPVEPTSAAEGTESAGKEEPVVSGFANAVAKILSHSTTPRPKKRIKRQVKEEESHPVQDASASPTASSVRSAETDSKRQRKGSSRDEPWHILPDVSERESERRLNKIATRGVVQLFNAVRQQQSDIAEQLQDAGPSVRRAENVLKAVSKGAFLHLLQDPAATVKIKSKQATLPDEQEGAKRWNVLDDDYLLQAAAAAAGPSLSEDEEEGNGSRGSSVDGMEQIF